MVGTLDMVRASNRTFGLKLEDGVRVRCVLHAGDIEAMAGLLNQPILILGTAVFGFSGRLLRVEVDEYRRATEADQFFAKVPQADWIAARGLHPPRTPKNGRGVEVDHRHLAWRRNRRTN